MDPALKWETFKVTVDVQRNIVVSIVKYLSELLAAILTLGEKNQELFDSKEIFFLFLVKTVELVFC